MTLAEEAQAAAKELLPDPWKNSSQESIAKCYERIRDCGVGPHTTKQIMADIIVAMREEYGE